MSHSESAAVLDRPEPHRYPHQTGQPVTVDALATDYQTHPDAYHEGLRPHIERMIGHQATGEAERPYERPDPKDYPSYDPEELTKLDNFFTTELMNPTHPHKLPESMPPTAETFYRIWNNQWTNNLIGPFLELGKFTPADQGQIKGFLLDKECDGWANNRPPANERHLRLQHLATAAPHLPDVELSHDEVDRLIREGHEADMAGNLKPFHLTAEQQSDFARGLVGASYPQDAEKIFDCLGDLPDAKLGRVGELLAKNKVISTRLLLENLERFEGMDHRTLLDRLYDQSPSSYNWDARLGDYLFKIHGVTPKDEAELTMRTNTPVRAFPFGASEKARNKWFAEQAHTYLDGGFSKDLIGKVIRLRIEHGLETNLHDASQWLSAFKMPDETYDIAYIKQHRTDPDFDREAIAPVRLKDPFIENHFIASIMHAPAELRARLNLSDRPDRIWQLFSNREQARTYFALVQKDESGVPLYRHPDLDWSLLSHAMTETDDIFGKEYAGFGHLKWDVTTDRKLTGNVFWGTTPENLEERYSNPGGSVSITDYISRLKEIGLRRKAYADDTATWLVRHATTPHTTLTKAWGDRAIALAHGVERDEKGNIISEVRDNASSVLAWQSHNGLKRLVYEDSMRTRLAEMGTSPDEILAPELKPWRDELTRVLSSSDTLTALVIRRKTILERRWSEKVLAADTVEFELGENSSKQWRLEILGPDDPRGFTLGVDTGCCMTIDGQSEDCLRAGYRSKNAGFIALYGPDGRLNAQSFWYVNPANEDVLVLDNIEANAGRDFSKITSAYQKGLQELLERHNARAREAGKPQIKQVNVGEGYTDVNIGQLPKTKAVPALNANIYTDAYSQRELLKLL